MTESKIERYYKLLNKAAAWAIAGAIFGLIEAGFAIYLFYLSLDTGFDVLQTKSGSFCLFTMWATRHVVYECNSNYLKTRCRAEILEHDK